MISAYLANARVTRIKIKMEPAVTQRIRDMLACAQTPTVTDFAATEFVNLGFFTAGLYYWVIDCHFSF